MLLFLKVHGILAEPITGNDDIQLGQRRKKLWRHVYLMWLIYDDDDGIYTQSDDADN